MPITGHTIEIFGLESFQPDLWYVWVLVQCECRQHQRLGSTLTLLKAGKSLYRNLKLLYSQRIVDGFKILVLLLMIKTTLYKYLMS